MCLFVIFYVLFVYMFVEDVALLRDEAGFADEELEHLLVCFITGAGGGDDVLLDHNRAHVVRAEA